MLYNRANGDGFMIFPEWTTTNLVFYSFLTLLALGIGPMEYRGWALMSYSKFRPSKGISGRLGMFILYFVPIIVLVLSALSYIANASFVQWVVFIVLFLHFAKRVLEVLFLHKYSGPIGLFTTLLISGIYSFAVFVVGGLNKMPLEKADGLFYFGILAFIVGSIGNFNHHRILAALRKDTFEYTIPMGGLFKYVTCPHYLFEIVAWFGIALMSRHLGAFLVLVFIIAYLSARAMRTLAWYREKFADYPAERKAIFPYIL